MDAVESALLGPGLDLSVGEADLSQLFEGDNSELPFSETGNVEVEPPSGRAASRPTCLTFNPQ